MRESVMIPVPELSASSPLYLTSTLGQKFMLDLILEICDKEFHFDNFEQCMTFFKNIINLCRQMNYSEFQSEAFNNYLAELKKEIEHE